MAHFFRIVFLFMLVAFLAIIAFGLTGCSSAEKAKEDNRPPEEIYREAKFELDRENFEKSSQLFDEIERQFPYSEWSSKAEIMAAYSYFQDEKFDDAIMALDRFIQLHPGNKNTPYAYYLRALCYYYQISDVYRDQKMTLLARDALAEVVRRFPDSAYAKDARIKYDLTVDHLAGKQMAVGRYYLNQGLYLAALNRFLTVAAEYQTTTHIEEALYRLTECYSILGLRKEAVRTAAVLGYNYPDSEWYGMAYKIAEADKEELAGIKEKEGDTWFGFKF